MKSLIFLLLLSSTCFSQDSYDQLKKLPKEKYQSAITDSIKKLESSDLGNFLYQIQNIDSNSLKPLNAVLVEKIQNSKSALNIHQITSILLQQNYNKQNLEEMLENKKSVWDKGEWSTKFWKLITENHLNIKSDSSYIIDSNGQKKYNVKNYIEDKIAKGEIGKKPLLILNYKPTSYEENQLIEVLNKLNIRDISISKSKADAPSLYGSRGIDGAINVLTR